MLTNQTTKQKTSIIKEIIDSIESNSLKFKPTTLFYQTVNINSKRFFKIYRGEISPSIEEVKAICKYFKVDPKDFI